MPGAPTNPLARDNAQRAYAESSLVSQATNLVQLLIQKSKFRQVDLAAKLGLTEGRVSQMRSDPGNMTLKSLAALCWALGYRIDLQPRAIERDLRQQKRRARKPQGERSEPWEVRVSLRPVVPSKTSFRPSFTVRQEDGSFRQAS